MRDKRKKMTKSESYVLDILYAEKELPIPAARIADKLFETKGYKPQTSYTLITRCVAKGFIKRTEPKFLCSLLITRSEFDYMMDLILAKEKYSIMEKALRDVKLTHIASLTPNISPVDKNKIK